MIKNNILRQYADNFMPEGLAQQIQNTDALLQNLAYEEYIPAIENILSIDEDATTEVTNDRIRDELSHLLDREIGEYGIGFETQDLEILTLILEALHGLPKYDNPQEILDLAEEEGLPQERFAEILGFYHNQDSLDFLKHFQYVNESLLDKLVSTLSHRLEMGYMDSQGKAPEEPVEPQEPSNAKLLKSFMDRYEAPHFNQLLEDGMKLGYDINIYLERVLDDMSQSVDDSAREYVAAAIASGESIQEALSQSGDRLEEYFDDLHRVEKVTREVRNYLERMYE